MADYPSSAVPAVISSFSKFAMAGGMDGIGGGVGAVTTAAWPTNNLGIFVPFWLPATFPLRSMFSTNITSSGNLDLGVYAESGALIMSKGSTAGSGSSALQILTLTETLLPAGRYFMAMSCSTTGATFLAASPSVLIQQMCGILQAASQLPLATLPTLATVANTYVPLFGIASITTF